MQRSTPESVSRRHTYPSRRWPRVFRPAIPTLIALVAVVACHELPTELPVGGQRLAPAPASLNLACDPDCGQWDSPDAGSYDGTVSNWDGSAPIDSLNPTGVFTYPTIVIINVSGDVHQNAGGLPGTSLYWGPTGTQDHQESMGMLVTSPQGSGIWWPAFGVFTDTIKITGTVYGFRNGLNDPQPDGGPTWTCGDYNHVPCWNYQGSAHLDFTRLDAQLTLTRTKSGPVDSGTVEVFSVGSAPTAIGGIPVDISNVRWRWVPTTATSDTLQCSSALTCSRTMRDAGTMYVSAYVNGVQKTASTQVRINRPQKPACDTVAMPELRSITLDTAMKHLWDDSNYSPTNPDTARREQGGWIIRNVSGTDTTYSFQRFPQSGAQACGIDVGYVPPAGAVGWMHTHPWTLGEKQFSCGPLIIIGGVPQYANYNGEASDDDNDIAGKFGENLVPPMTGGLPGYVLDVNGINKFDANKAPGIRFSRCSY